MILTAGPPACVSVASVARRVDTWPCCALPPCSDALPRCMASGVSSRSSRRRELTGQPTGKAAKGPEHGARAPKTRPVSNQGAERGLA